MRIPALALCVLLPGLASGQVGLADHSDLSRGATLLPRSTAWADGATAGQYNPAGINKVPLVELVYAHERSNARQQTIDGLYAGAAFAGAGLGLSLEWLRDDAGAQWRKSNLTVAFGFEALSVGLGLGFFTGGPADALASLELGVQSRFARWGSVGFTARNLNAPAAAGTALARSYQLGLGLRPFGERLSVGADFLVGEAGGFRAGRLGYTAELELFRGLKLWAGLSHGVTRGALLYLQGGLSLDAGHLGAAYAASGSLNGLNHLAMARASVDPVRGVRVFPRKLLLVALDGLADDGGGNTLGTLLGMKPENTYLRALLNLEAAATDPDFEGVVLKIQGSGLGLGRAEEVRQAVLKVRLSGKKVFAYLLSATDADYLIASAADQIYAAHDAMLTLDGLVAQSTFLGGTMEKLGVSWDVARVGEFKNAPDLYTRKEMSEQQRTTLEAYLDTNEQTLEQAVTRGRRLSPEAWRAAVDEGLKSVRRAKELGLVDEILAPVDIEKRLEDQVPGAKLMTDVAEPQRSGRWGTRPRIAVLPVIGTIAGGDDTSDPFGLTNTAGARTFIRALDALVRDTSVKAIVLRIESPGGDGLASGLMYRAVLEAKKKKPVVASMGDVAASGGYYVAMGAEEVWAEPTTLTGSIGVFVLKPAVEKLADTLGVHHQSIRRGKQAGVFDIWEPWTPEQAESAQHWVDDFYDTFITEVAQCRKLPKPEVDQAARGRVWSGADARQKGLIDQLGGLADAIVSARGRAGLGPSRDHDVVLLGASGGLLGDAFAQSAVATGLLARPAAPQSKLAALEKLAGELGLAALPQPGAVQARMEFDLTVR